MAAVSEIELALSTRSSPSIFQKPDIRSGRSSRSTRTCDPSTIGAFTIFASLLHQPVSLSRPTIIFGSHRRSPSGHNAAERAASNQFALRRRCQQWPDRVFADHAATTFGPNSVWAVNRPANSAVLITDLARRPIFWKNVFFRRDRNEKPHVPDRSRPCDTCWGRLWRQPRQPIRPIPEAVEVIRGAASNAVARRVWNCRCNARRRVHFVRIRNNPHHRRFHGWTGDGSRLIRCD
jgi:hypothetical protein